MPSIRCRVFACRWRRGSACSWICAFARRPHPREQIVLGQGGRPQYTRTSRRASCHPRLRLPSLISPGGSLAPAAHLLRICRLPADLLSRHLGSAASPRIPRVRMCSLVICYLVSPPSSLEPSPSSQSVRDQRTRAPTPARHPHPPSSDVFSMRICRPPIIAPFIAAIAPSADSALA